MYLQVRTHAERDVFPYGAGRRIEINPFFFSFSFSFFPFSPTPYGRTEEVRAILPLLILFSSLFIFFFLADDAFSPLGC